MTSDQPELIELDAHDLSAVEVFTGDPAPGGCWVGVRAQGRILGVAGWTSTPAGVRLLGPHLAPEQQQWASALISAVEELAAATIGQPALIEARAVTPAEVAVLRVEGYRGEPPVLVRSLPVLVDVPTTAAMQDLGRHLATHLRAGDLVIATGDLGAGKTTLTQGIAAGLGVAEPVTSPTFVLSRIHPGGQGRPDLVHVDAYRLLDADEIDDIDLDLHTSVTVIEWGAGIAEHLSDHRLEIDIRRSEDPAEETREVIMRPVGERWFGVVREVGVALKAGGR